MDGGRGQTRRHFGIESLDRKQRRIQRRIRHLTYLVSQGAQNVRHERDEERFRGLSNGLLELADANEAALLGYRGGIGNTLRKLLGFNGACGTLRRKKGLHTHGNELALGGT